MRVSRRIIPEVVSRKVSIVFYPETGTFNETFELGMVNPDGVIEFTTKVNPQPAGTVDGSTLHIYKDGRRHNAARLAWYHHHDETLPLRTRVNHIDGDVWNNRKENLVVVKPPSHHAITRIAGRVVSLGRFETRREADDAVAAARQAVGMGPVKTRNRNPERKS